MSDLHPFIPKDWQPPPWQGPNGPLRKVPKVDEPTPDMSKAVIVKARPSDPPPPPAALAEVGWAQVCSPLNNLLTFFGLSCIMPRPLLQQKYLVYTYHEAPKSLDDMGLCYRTEHEEWRSVPTIVRLYPGSTS